MAAPARANGRTNRVTKQTERVGQMTELGVTGLQVFGGQVTEEFLRQLKGTLFIRTMREMAENDEVIGAMQYAMEMLLRQVSWSVESEAEYPQQYVDYVDSLPGDMSHTWSDFISEWNGTTPVFGYGPFEIVWKRRNGASRDPSQRSRYTDGLIGVRKLAVRHPDTLIRWIMDDAGGVQGMEQQKPAGGTARIPIEKMLLFRVRSRKGSPEGTSLLRNAYVSWYRKKRIATIEAIGIERDLAGLPVMYTPPQWHLADASAGDKALLEEAKKIVRNIRIDEQHGVVLPSVFDADNNERILKLELLSNQGASRGKVDTSAVIERLDRRMMMTILADVILLGHEKVGSFALASSKTNLFAAGLGALLDSIQDVINRHLLPRAFELNGWPLDQIPELRHGDVESIDLNELGDYILKLSQSGAPLFPNAELEGYVKRAANLPDTEAEPEELAVPETEMAGEME